MSNAGTENFFSAVPVTTGRDGSGGALSSVVGTRCVLPSLSIDSEEGMKEVTSDWSRGTEGFGMTVVK